MRLHNFRTYRKILCSTGFARTVWGACRNLRADSRGERLPAGPYLAELDVTYRCNLECRMCQRWRDPRRGELSLADYRALAAELSGLGTHQISIAGGEPLLRPEIFEIIEAFAGRGLSVNLCTNGLLLRRYRREIAASGARCVTVSLDGTSPGCHDRLRGRPGAHAAVEGGIEAFLSSRANGFPILRVRMTVSQVNAGEVGAFYRRWAGVAEDVLLQPLHHCADAFYTGMEPEAVHPDPAVLARELGGTPLAADPYLQRWIEALEGGTGVPDRPCYAGVLMARIDPWGNVYPCLEQHVRVGSIRGASFAAVWNGEALRRERGRLANGRGCRCWYNNTALIGHFGGLLAKGLGAFGLVGGRCRPGAAHPPSRGAAGPLRG